MTGAEAAEAFLIVAKRLTKWFLWGLACVVVLCLLILAYVEGKKYFDNRPYRATRYAELELGQAQSEVLYALGPPPEFIDPTPVNDGNPFSKFGLVVESSKAGNVTYADSKEWMYSGHHRRTDVAFDKPGGSVTSITCFSDSAYSCPPLFGIRDGSTEEEVLSQLGKPGSERLDGVTKMLRFPQFNLTLYLEKRRVYMLKLSDGAAP